MTRLIGLKGLLTASLSIVGQVFQSPLHYPLRCCRWEGWFVVLGISTGAILGWHLNVLGALVTGIYQPEKMQIILGIAGALVVCGLLATNRYCYWNTNKVFMTIWCCIGVLVFGNAIEMKWFDPQANYFLIGGIIPSSDADGWITGGWRVLESASLSTYDQRRPINAALHAFRLFLSGDLSSSILLAGLVAGAVSVYSSMVIRQSLGWLSAATFFVVCLELVREHLPLAMTEIHGFIYGGVAFFMLWRAATDRSVIAFSFGLALLSVGLNARSGPFLVLPAILAWGVINLSSNDRRYSMSTLVWGVLGITAGFVISKWFLLLWSSGENIQQSNFSLTLYGMAVGGKGWEQAYIDNPNIFSGSFGGVREAEIAKSIYGIALRTIVADPMPFLVNYFSQLEHFVRSFMKYDLGLSRILTFTTGIWILMRWREPLSQLGILSFLGILFSAPFLMQDAGVRPFSPVYPMLAAIPAIGIGLITRSFLIWKKNTLIVSNDPKRSVRGIFIIGVLSLLVTVLGPVLSVSAYKSPVVSEPWCNSGETNIVLNSHTSVLVNVLSEDLMGITRVPEISRARFLSTFPESQSKKNKIAISKISPPYSFVSTYVSESDSRYYMVLSGKPRLGQRETLLVCLPNDKSSDYVVGYVYSHLQKKK